MKSKTTISDEQVERILSEIFPDGITDLLRIVAGEFAQAFSFKHQNRAYILRVSQRSESLDDYNKENKVYDLLPATVKVARNEKVFAKDGMVYSLALRIPGKTLMQLRKANEQTEDDIAAATEQLIDILQAILEIDVSTYTGFGTFDMDLNGAHKTWCDYLLSKLVHRHVLSWRETIVNEEDIKIYDSLVEQINALIKQIPDTKKSLVHGDFGEGNVLFENGSVTGIIDWGGAKWGDHLYDVAIFDMWTPQYELVAKYKQKYPDFESFDQRIRCYQLIMILSALGHYARNENAHGYEWLRGLYKNRYLEI